MKFSTRNVCVLLILMLYSSAGRTQTPWIDSIKKVIETQKEDTTKVLTFLSLSDSYRAYYPDSGLFYAQKGLALAEKLNYEYGIFWSVVTINASLYVLGNYPLELDYCFRALSLAKKMNTVREIGFSNGMLSDYYYNMGEYALSLKYLREVVRICEKHFPDETFGIWAGLSRIFESNHQPDSALLYAKKTYEVIKRQQSSRTEDYQIHRAISLISPVLGNAFAGKADYDSALFYYRMGIPVSKNNYLETDMVDDYNGIAAVYKAKGLQDSAVWYAQKVLTEKIIKTYPVGLLKAANLLTAIYETQNKADSTLKYLRLSVSLKDSLFNREKMIAIKDLTYREQEKQKQIEAAGLKLNNTYKLYFLLAGFIAVLIIAGILLKSRQQKQLQHMRNSIADDLHDDIGSTLSSISIMTELVKKKSPEALSLLDTIGESSISLQENMSDIVWAVNPANDRFENLLVRMNRFASEILDAKNIELDFSGDASLSSLKLTMEQRKNFYLFFKEVINNAAKYSDAGKVIVRISRKAYHIEMDIADDGKGFDMTEAVNGNGMTTLRKRGEELNADFKIVSHVNEGTGVMLKFKIT